MKITPRLLAIAEKVPPGSAVADIGTDHAYLPIYLIENGTAVRAVGIELAEHPLSNARQQVERAGYADLIDIRKGYGLEPLRIGEASVVILAGMGGGTVIEILERGRQLLREVNRLILQPMNDIEEIRRWLIGNSWEMVEEDLAREGKMFYIIITAEPAASAGSSDLPYTDLELEVGPLLIRRRHPLLKEYLVVLIEREKKKLSQMRRSRRPEIKPRENAALQRLRELRTLAGVSDEDQD